MAWLPLFIPAIQQQFLGDPNSAVTAINTTGGIAEARDYTGYADYQTPCWIHVSAKNITATGTTRPAEDLYFTWNFGDSTHNYTLIDPASSSIIDQNSGQIGMDAVYCYSVAGTYTITLTITGRTVGGGRLSVSKTKSVTVTAFDTSGGEWWFDSVNGLDSNNGTSSITPKQTLSAINSKVANKSTLHLAKGSVWAGSGLVINPGASIPNGLRIDAYGSGVSPRFEGTSAATSVLTVSNGGNSSPRDVKDVVITGVDFKKTAGDGGGVAGFSTGNTSGTVALFHIYLDGCVFNHNFDGNTAANNVVVIGGDIDQGVDILGAFGFIRSTFINPLNSNTIGIGLQGGPKKWYFIYSNYYEGAASNVGGSPGSTFDHHIYYDTKENMTVQYCTFGPTGTGFNQRNFCINGNWDEEPRPLNGVAQWHYIARNKLQYTIHGIDFGNASNNAVPPNITYFDGTVAELNAFVNMGADGNPPMLFGCGRNITFRYNRSWGGGLWYWPENDGGLQQNVLLSKLYGNKIDVISSAPATNAIIFFDGFQFDSSAWTTKQEVTYNTLRDLRASANIQQMVLANATSAGCLYDHNTYYAPNSTNYLYDHNTPKTLGNYQSAGFDANSTYINPGWVVPVAQWSDMN